MSIVKTCIKCDRDLPATKEYFYRNKYSTDGLLNYCKECRTKQQIEHYKKPKNKERIKQYKKEWVKSPRGRDLRLKKMYGISLQEYDAMFDSQHGVCKICGGVNKSGKRLSVDHNHLTGKVRGLLCQSCNFMVGLSQENSDILLKTALYLRENK